MDGPIRASITSSTFHSLPINNEDNTSDHAPRGLIPSSSSRASSVTVHEQDAYTQLQPTVHTHGWKPETMQPTVLLALALASVLLAALLEILAQKSAADGALCLVDAAADIPPLVSFAHLYLPTITAVLYSLVWNWVDLDVKRMQPWLQLSRAEGATGRDSLFLDYPVDFVAFVPFRAAKKRHWASFYSGTIVVFVFWVLTPMQGAVFGTAPVLARHTVNMSYPVDLVEASQQAAMLDQSILNAGYAVTWLNQTLPPYTTPEYTLRPFSPSGLSAAANWTGPTTKYWTALSCWPAAVTRVPGMPPGIADFDDGRGCNASALEVHSGRGGADPYKMTYIGYQGGAWADYSLRCPTCGPAAHNEFLATMAAWDADAEAVRFTSAFCETRYWRQEVTATVTAGARRPVEGSVRPRGPPAPLRDAEFNTSAFEYLLGAGVSSVDRPRDYPFTSLLEHYGRLQTSGLQYPLSPMVGFAVGGQNYTVDRYAANATILTRAFEAAHKMLFSVAYARLLVNAPATVPAMQGEAVVAQYGVVVGRMFSALVEGVLLLVALMALLLLRACRRGRSMLSEDPASMDALLRLVADDGELRALFSGTGHMNDEELRLRLGGYIFQLRCGCCSGRDGPTLAIVRRPDDDDEVSKGELLGKEFNQPGYLAPEKPVVLRKWAGLVFISVLVGVTVLLIYLKRMDAVFGGLSRPSSSFEVNLLLTSYLPTAFSTLVEPLWVLLNRFHCMLQPFYDLVDDRRDRAGRTHHAMQSRYTALPPQLAFVRALRARHALLAAVCVTALLGNVLAVGLGALLNERPTDVPHARSFAPRRQPGIAAGTSLDEFLRKITLALPARYDDPYYVVMANLSYGTALPPWTTNEFSFLPLAVPDAAQQEDSAADGSSLYTSETTGFGVDPGCVSLGVLESENKPAQTQIGDLPALAKIGGCAQTYTPASLFLNNTDYAMPVGAAAAEVVDTLTNTYNYSACDETLILGWSRATLRNRTGTLRTSMVACSPTLRTARFRVTFDAAGHVRTATPLATFSSTWPYQNTSVAGQPILAALHYRLRNRGLQWHANGVSRDWFNYLVEVYAKAHGGGGALFDPAAPLPSPGDMVEPVSAVYKMIFAVLLSLNPDIWVGAPTGAKESGTQVLQETRVFMSTPAFVVCVVILGIYVVMAAVYYSVAVKLFLPRMPSTVGSMLAYTVPSSIAKAEAMYPKEALRFGRYVGLDGHAQIGIDTVDKIVPLDMSRLGHGNTRPSRFKFPRFGRPSRATDAWL